jgi:hypothetical protein
VLCAVTRRIRGKDNAPRFGVFAPVHHRIMVNIQICRPRAEFAVPPRSRVPAARPVVPAPPGPHTLGNLAAYLPQPAASSRLLAGQGRFMSRGARAASGKYRRD